MESENNKPSKQAKNQTHKKKKRFVFNRVGTENWMKVQTSSSMMNKYQSVMYNTMTIVNIHWASLVAQMLKNLPPVQETQVQSLGWEDPLEKGNRNPLQYSCLENPHGQRSLVATVHGVAKSWT